MEFVRIVRIKRVWTMVCLARRRRDNVKPNGHRKPRRLPAVLTGDEQARLLAAIDTDSPAGMRNLLIIRVMLDAGLRSAECLALRHQDVDLKSGQLMVRNGKGGKDRSLWLGSDLVALLGSYIETQGKVRPGDYLFTSRTGQRLTTGYLRSLVRVLAVKAGIEGKHVHVHTLRHSFATDLLRDTKNLVLVQQALGHSSITTTTIYTHITNPELEAAMKNIRNGEGV
jgi:integrase/recombinase XerD